MSRYRQIDGRERQRASGTAPSQGNVRSMFLFAIRRTMYSSPSGHHHSRTTAYSPTRSSRPTGSSPGINFKETFWLSSECNFLQPILVSAVVVVTRFGANATFSLAALPRNRGLKNSHYLWCYLMVCRWPRVKTPDAPLSPGVIIPVEGLTTRLKPSPPEHAGALPGDILSMNQRLVRSSYVVCTRREGHAMSV